ncbi:MAG: hypothetical protein Q8S15_01740 [Erysipelotrichaceae bacterium]|nr:hypothetical protein [Erysipelotrichaceae bacterium]MDP3304786.1 hypothetical protein [Erysipelotrichaceae bacterium]
MTDFKQKFEERLTAEVNQQYQMFELREFKKIEHKSPKQLNHLWLQLAMIPIIISLSLYGANIYNYAKYEHYRKYLTVIDALKLDDASTYNHSFEEVINSSSSIVFVEFIKLESFEYKMELKSPFFKPGIYNMVETIAHLNTIETIKGDTEKLIKVSVNIFFKDENPWNGTDVSYDPLPIPEFESGTQWILFLQDKEGEHYQYFPLWTYQIINGSVVSQYALENTDKHRNPDRYTGLTYNRMINQVKSNIRK